MFTKIVLTDDGLDARRVLGSRGEEFAAAYLERAGYRLVVKNFKVPVGRNSRGAEVTGEIDIVALDGETLCFVEVKTRVSADLFAPIVSVDTRKQRQITRTAKIYRRVFGVWDMPFRYDVVSVVLSDDRPVIELTKGFWTDAKFKKRRWATHYRSEYF